MGFELRSQLICLLLALPLGMLVAAVYDVFRIIRVVFGAGRVAALVEDTLFWLITAVAVFAFFLLTSDGEVRFYPFVSMLLGAYVYFKTVGNDLNKF